MTVYANGLEVSAKAQGCKIVAAFPDTCFTPPQAPPTPPGVPIPYPNFATDGDVAKGTGTVKIGGKEVSQENASKWSKVTGDEAGAAPKKGIVTSKNRGAAYAQKWSMDVKAEGKGVVRFSDIATTNHGSMPGNDVPWPVVGTAAFGMSDIDSCKDNVEAIHDNCSDYDSMDDACAAAGLGGAKPRSGANQVVRRSADSDGPALAVLNQAVGASYVQDRLRHLRTTGSVGAQNQHGGTQGFRIAAPARDAWIGAQANPCVSALRCRIVPYEEGSKGGCCPGQTPHHLVPKSFFHDAHGTALPGAGAYDEQKAPCICVEGTNQTSGSHGRMHDMMKSWLTGLNENDPSRVITSRVNGKTVTRSSVTYKETCLVASASVETLFKFSECDPDCITDQVNAQHKAMPVPPGDDDDMDLHGEIAGMGRPVEEGRRRLAALDIAHSQIARMRNATG